MHRVAAREASVEERVGARAALFLRPTARDALRKRGIGSSLAALIARGRLWPLAVLLAAREELRGLRIALLRGVPACHARLAHGLSGLVASLFASERRRRRLFAAPTAPFDERRDLGFALFRLDAAGLAGATQSIARSLAAAPAVRRERILASAETLIPGRPTGQCAVFLSSPCRGALLLRCPSRLGALGSAARAGLRPIAGHEAALQRGQRLRIAFLLRPAARRTSRLDGFGDAGATILARGPLRRRRGRAAVGARSRELGGSRGAFLLRASHALASRLNCRGGCLAALFARGRRWRQGFTVREEFIDFRLAFLVSAAASQALLADAFRGDATVQSIRLLCGNQRGYQKAERE
jgi:hypothetical protein